MSRAATVYRMVMDEHVCPYGLKTIDLLKRQGFEVNDHHLTSREETDAFKERHDVETTPQTFIKDERIGGYDDVREFFGKKPLFAQGWRYQLPAGHRDFCSSAASRAGAELGLS